MTTPDGCQRPDAPRSEPETGVTRRRVLAASAGATVLGGFGIAADRWPRESLDTEPLEGRWERGPDLPSPAAYPAVAAHDEAVYVFGGGDSEGRSQSATYRFDPGAGRWTERAPMPVAARRTSASVLDDRIYIVDGSTNDALFGDGTVRIYDPAADRWTVGTERPVSTRDPGQATDGERVYLFGGNIGGTSRQFAHAYDPATDRWTERSALPFPNRQFSCHYVPSEGKIYLFGGESPDSGPELDTVLAYDPATDSYDMSPTNLARPSQTVASAVHRGMVLLAGGEEPGGTTGSQLFRVYDPGTDRWSRLPRLPAMVESTDAAVAGNALVVPGGRTYVGPHAPLDAEPHTYRYGQYPVFLDRTLVYRFE